MDVIVLIPVFLLQGLSGSFFRPLDLSYILAIIASLFVALTLTPALSLMILPKRYSKNDAEKISHDTPLVHWLKVRFS